MRRILALTNTDNLNGSGTNDFFSVSVVQVTSCYFLISQYRSRGTSGAVEYPPRVISGCSARHARMSHYAVDMSEIAMLSEHAAFREEVLAREVRE